MNSAQVLTKKDARALVRMHASLTALIGQLDGLAPKRKTKRRRIAKAAAAPTTKKTPTQRALDAARTKAARLTQNDE